MKTLIRYVLYHLPYLIAKVIQDYKQDKFLVYLNSLTPMIFLVSQNHSKVVVF